MANLLRSRYDIIINGGGVVGFTLLNLISKSPHLRRLKVLLIEQAPKPKTTEQVSRTVELKAGNFQEQFSNRVSSINKASVDCLQKLEVWPQLHQFKKDVNQIKVWNYDYSNRIEFQQARPSTQVPLFSVIENNRLYSCLVKNLHKHPQQTDSVIWNHSLEQMSQSQTGEEKLVDVIATNTETGQQLNLTSSLVIGCDGFKSKVRDLANISYREKHCGHRAVVGTIRISNTSKTNEIAYQRFSSEKNTVAALLPLNEEYCSFVISAPEEYSQWLLECDEDTFIDQFNELLSKREHPTETSLLYLHKTIDYAAQNLKTLLQVLPVDVEGCSTNFEQPPVISSVVSNSRASFPLASGTTSPKMIASLPGCEHSQIALLGDSSHRVHPLAGQGLNLGIQDAVELVKNLEEPVSRGERVFNDFDHFLLDKALSKFQLNRQLHIVPIHGAISILPTLFKLSPTSLISAVNMCNPLKTASMRIANGF